LSELTAVDLTKATGKKMREIIPTDDPDFDTYDYLGIEVDPDMIEYVQEFLIWANGQVPSGHSILNRDIVHVEERMTTAIDDEVSGTTDLSITDWPVKLHIIDFKYGQGKQVDAVDNPQLAIYGLGAIEKFGDDFDTIELTIYQPRGEGPTVKTWEMPLQKFQDKWERIVRKGYEEALAKTNLFRPGEWCKWCRGASDCGRAKRGVSSMAKPDAVVPRDVKALSRILNLETAVLEYLNQCKAKAYEHLHAGQPVPGFKLVRHFGREKFSSDKEALDILNNLPEKGNKAISFAKPKPKTPKQCRKVLGDAMPEELEALTMTPDKGLILVPESDRREAYAGALEDFNDDVSNHD
jgi:hypothetical protein